jgi:secreted trypsin-like serine protease
VPCDLLYAHEPSYVVCGRVAIFFSVLAGTNVLSQGGERRHVLRYWTHGQYDPENYENDIAVVEVSVSRPDALQAPPAPHTARLSFVGCLMTLSVT